MSENPSNRRWMAGVIDRNIRELLERQRAEQVRVPREIRLADRVTAFTGSMRFVYFHFLLFGAWTIWNVPWTPLPKFDSTFIIMATFASVEAIFLSTFVLITQNRMSHRAARRAELDLQISLLAEHEITQLITLVKALGQHFQIDQANEPELSELEEDVAPSQVLDVIEKQENGLGPSS